MSNIKMLRGQVRQIVKEILPEVLNQEQYAELKKHVDSRIQEVDKYIRETLSHMDERHKQVMGYLLHTHDEKNQPPSSEDPAPVAAIEEPKAEEVPAESAIAE